MDTEVWKEEYHKINQSFRPKLVFRVGADAGFYSEINNLILGVIYSLKHKINFNIQTEGNTIFFDKGWCDYFQPFFNESHYFGLKKYNVRPYNLKGRSFKYIPPILKKIYNITYLTQDLFNKFRTTDELSIYEPRLNLHGNLLDISKVIIENIYKFNTEIETNFKKQINFLNLPEDYIGIHIRRGDKVEEASEVNTKSYLDFILKNFKSRSIFVATDDYNIITELSRLSNNIKIFTLAAPNECGYFHSKFINSSPEVRKKQILKMLLNMEILTTGKYFVGTYDSNIGMFIQMRKGGINCFDVINREWKLW